MIKFDHEKADRVLVELYCKTSNVLSVLSDSSHHGFIDSHLVLRPDFIFYCSMIIASFIPMSREFAGFYDL